ncbi:SIS domain-containing protein [Streptomyces netropsis]|uniref:Glucose/mannose-6-phosphate isomerase n=1 Tax=Streptomyces netropsis TaxID=55404 RepID=A0A7W7PFD0_STRNE|nr:SIS domain-containing protein [Streptomyces netropsis]MBB4887118.1 glucose/mannose-6-phosphate isomerase [Streptomyces netropsis]
MKSRLDRYEEFIEKEYRAGLTKPDEYSLEAITPKLRSRFANGEFKRIVFTGMGCSAIVSDIVRGYFAEIGSPIEVHVLNDYDFRFLAPSSVLDDEGTLYIISSYSGHSQEPVLAYQGLKSKQDRVLLLTSGGKLAGLGQADGVSIAYWRLREPDREYPLFHVSQYFAILMDMFHKLGLLDDNHHTRLAELSAELEADYDNTRRELVERVAHDSQDANVIMIASPKWHESLLKLAKMHFNEMSMVPAARNYFHEFCHSEVATLSDPDRKHSVIWFADPDDDDYTIAKGENLVRLLTEERPENLNVRISRVDLGEGDFLRKYFNALNIVQHTALALGRYHETNSRDLISESAGNPWYHSTTIESELAGA